MVRRFLILVCLVCPLVACVPAVVVMGAAVGGAVIYDKRSFKTRASDHKATMQATKKIREDKQLKGRAHVRVAVFNGIGLLVGQASEPTAKQEAGVLVASIPNVRRVYNRVQLVGSAGTLQRANDSWIAGKVRTNMLLKAGLRSSNVKIIAEDGVVYLMGSVNRKQSLLAVNVARHVSGVKKVVKVFEYD